MKLTQEGIEAIKQHEGMRLVAYPDPGSRDGHPWTIGYGHTSLAGAPPVTKGMRITQEQADEIFERDINKFADGVRKYIKRPLNDNQFSAFVSFAYNIGLGGFARSSALRAANAGNFDVVPSKLALWNKNDGKVMRGLVNRRAAEGELFMRPVDGVVDKPEVTNKFEPSQGKPMSKSSTAKATGVLVAIGAAKPVSDAVESVTEIINTGKTFGATLWSLGVPVLFVIVIGIAGWWIWKERKRHSEDNGT
jgi:GH24 family phage-related lysozyme (muramidase)